MDSQRRAPAQVLEVVEIWPTVEEFVNHFHHCSVVFTNSYHGTIFGLKFQREIFVVPRDIYPDKQNLRLEYLMRLLSVHGRYIDLNNYETLSEVSDIDYELVEKKLKLFQASGQEFLRMHAPAADE